MQRAYPARINWENEPSTASPINDTNLNKMDAALYTIDGRVVEFDTTKANQSDLLTCLSNINYNTSTGVFTFTWKNGTSTTVDLNIEKIPVSFSMSPQGVITMVTSDGTEYTADVSSLIKTYSFTNSSTINFTVTTDASGNKTVVANIPDGSITAAKLQPNYLADCQEAVSDAETAASQAETSADEADISASDSEAWAVGTRHGVPVTSSDETYHNNSKYWSDQSAAQTFSGLSDVNIDDSTLTDGQVPVWDAVNEEWKNGNAGTDRNAVHWGEQSKGYVGKNELIVDAVSETKNGVTFTVNADKSITLNGTASSTWGWNICEPSTTSNLRSLRGDYILSYEGTLASGCGVSLQLNTGNYVNIDNTTHTTSTTFTDSIYPTGRLHIYIVSGSVWSNNNIKPMIRLASISDSTYEPYLTPNTDLMSYADNTILGAKNLIPFPYNKRATGSTTTINGITWTINSDGSVSATGTSTADSWFNLAQISNTWKNNVYILSGGQASSINNRIQLRCKVNTTDSNNDKFIQGYQDIEQFFDGNYISDKNYIDINVCIPSGQTVSNFKFYPMVRLASDTDPTYALYAMTNRELTNAVDSKLPLSGGTITGDLTLKRNDIDAKQSNNGVSSVTYPTTFNVLDKNGYILTRKEAVVKPDGNIEAYWYVRNYNTSGTQVAQKGIRLAIDKSGNLTYTVDDAAKFRTAIGLDEILGDIETLLAGL